MQKDAEKEEVTPGRVVHKEEEEEKGLGGGAGSEPGNYGWVEGWNAPRKDHEGTSLRKCGGIVRRDAGMYSSFNPSGLQERTDLERRKQCMCLVWLSDGAVVGK